MAVPSRLEHGVAESQVEHVLNRFFAQVVVKAEDLIFTHDRVQSPVQVHRCVVAGTERLLEDHASITVEQVGVVQMLCDHNKQLRRRIAEVERCRDALVERLCLVTDR